jgi:hypothetical protein
MAVALASAIIDWRTPHASAQGFFEQLFGGDDAYYYGYRYGYRPRPAHARKALHGRPPARQVEKPATRVTPPEARAGDVVVETASGSRSYCVRECDGFFFPVGIYSGASDQASHQRACSRLCPGAKTSLFVLRPGSDKIEDAVAARGGASYSKLAAALRRKEPPAEPRECSCRAATPESPIRAIYRDPTLRRGDAIMTAHGMEIFHGGAHYPYTTSDFRSLAETRDLPQRTRRMLAALERGTRRGHSGEVRRAGRPLSEHRSQAGGDRR